MLVLKQNDKLQNFCHSGFFQSLLFRFLGFLMTGEVVRFLLGFVISRLNCYGCNQQPTSQCDLWSWIPQNIGSYKDTQQSTERKPQHHQTHQDMGRYFSTLEMKSKTYICLEFGRIDATIFVKFLRGELCDLLMLFQSKVDVKVRDSWTMSTLTKSRFKFTLPSNIEKEIYK